MAESDAAAAEVMVERSGPHVWIFTLNRPQARNAVNGTMAAAMAAGLRAFDTDSQARVGVVTGAGTGFCAGLDLKAFTESGELGETAEGGFCGFCRQGPRKPLIAAVEGYALAGGLEVALACDLVVASESARMGIPEVRRGLVADGGALLRLPRDLPRQVAMEMAITGGEVDVARLHQLGLVNRVCPPGEALATAIVMAGQIAANAPLAVVATKEILLSQQWWAAEERWSRQEQVARPVWNSRDAAEGATAFAQRRSPVFEGR